MIYRIGTYYYYVKGKSLIPTNFSNYADNIQDHYKCYHTFDSVDFSLIDSIDFVYRRDKFGLYTVFCRNSADMDIISTIFELL